MARVDRASRLIKATPQAIYRAHLDPEAIATWRPPKGMTAEIHAFEPYEGGLYRMAFVYLGDGQGKTSEKADVFEGRFVELTPDQRIVERVAFESSDPRFAGTMTITTTLTPEGEATRVDVAISDVPPGITPQDHQAGMDSSLANLAAYVE
jgi:uncharacterized protein YndB with AHSA1/START domain